MNKKVSKTLAAVLSAAMAASAFAVSTGAAFAADNQISAKTITTSIGIGSDRNAATTGIDLKALAEKLQPTFTVNGVDYAGGKIELDSTGWHTEANDTSLVAVDNTTNILKPGTGAARLDEPRTVVLTHTATATAANVGTFGTSSTHLTGLSVTVEITVTVYPDDRYIILPSDTYANGSAPASEITLSMNQGVDLDTYQIDTASGSGEAVFKNVSHTVGDDYYADELASFKLGAGNRPYVGTSDGGNDTYDVIGYTSSNERVVSFETEANNAGSGKIAPQNPDNVQTGSAEINVDVYHTDENNDSNGHWFTWADEATAEAAIPFTVNVDDTYKVMGTGDSTFVAEGNRTESTDGYDVEGKDIVVDLAANEQPSNEDNWEGDSVAENDDNNGNVNINIGADAVVGNIDAAGYEGDITVTGETGDIVSDGTVNVQDLLGDNYPKAGTTIKAGDISAHTINVLGTNAENNTTYTYQTVETGNLDASNINITAYDNGSATSPMGYGRVVVKDITIRRDAQDSGVLGVVNTGLTLTAGKYVNTMELGSISGQAGPYEDSPFGAQVTVAQGKFDDLGDLNRIGKVTIGTKDTSADVTVGTIDTGVVNMGYDYVDQTHSESAVQVNGGSALTADSITADEILQKNRSSSGYGSITMTAPNSLFVKNDSGNQSSATSTYLYVPDAKVGDTLYTAYNTSGRNYIFMPVSGMDVLAQPGANKSYNFILQSVAFQGIRMTDTNVSVGETPVTLSLAAMPDSTTLPEGVTVSWTATTDTAGKQTVSLTPSADGMSCVVTATGYTADNINNGNNVVVTATLMKDGKVYCDVAANTATANVTLTDVQADKPLTGIALSETSMTMQPEETQQLTVTYTPADTNSDKTVTWSTSDEAVATVDAEGNVTAVADGTATITATCGEFTATCEVTVSENPFTVVVTNAEGEKTTCALDGSTVIEVPQSMAFNFDISSEEEIADFDYTVGNCKVGGTNTNTVWNGTSGSYQIYAAGAVGSETGAYINGIKIFTLRVTDRPFTSDTTLNMNISRGQTYQFAITPDDPNASFTFLTANGEALSTSYNKAVYPDATGTYYCKVTANAVNQDVGVYCVIDGKTYKVFTAHLVG